VYRDAGGAQQIHALSHGQSSLTLGRDPENELAFEWDAEASRLHAQLARLGGQWTIADDGLSSNGTFVNGERLTGQRRLRDGDVIVCGTTAVAFRWQRPGEEDNETRRPVARNEVPELSPAQKRVLIALCRPLKSGGGHILPASNQQIADELVVSVDAVKASLRLLFEKFAVEDLPHNHKRIRLADLALMSGVISPRDL
jgi:hypothetical protein